MCPSRGSSGRDHQEPYRQHPRTYGLLSPRRGRKEFVLWDIFVLFFNLFRSPAGKANHVITITASYILWTDWLDLFYSSCRVLRPRSGSGEVLLVLKHLHITAVIHTILCTDGFRKKKKFSCCSCLFFIFVLFSDIIAISFWASHRGRCSCWPSARRTVSLPDPVLNYDCLSYCLQ